MKRMIVLTTAVWLCLGLQARTIVVKDSVRAEVATVIEEHFVASTTTGYVNRTYTGSILWNIINGRVTASSAEFGKDNNYLTLKSLGNGMLTDATPSIISQKLIGVKKISWLAKEYTENAITQMLYYSKDSLKWYGQKYLPIEGNALSTIKTSYYVEFDTPQDVYIRLAARGVADNYLYIDSIVIETYPWEYSSHEEEKWDFTKEVTKDSACIVCYDKAVEAGDFAGAEFYEIAYQTMDGIVVDEVKELEAGMPYVMLATDTQFGCDWTGDAVMQAGNHNGLYGTLTEITNSEELEDMWIISGNELWQIGTDCQMGPNKGYINMSQVPTTETTLAPGRKRVTLSGSGSGVSTALPFRTIPNKIRCGLIMRSGRLMVCKEGNIYSLCGERIR